MSIGLFPGDQIIPQPSMLYNQMITINTTPDTIFPWLLQLGKGRGGWYVPAWIERFFPTSWQAAHDIKPQWQNLNVGDRVPDYGFSSDDYFIVRELREPEALVYQSERYGCTFTWALLLREAVGEGDAIAPKTELHLRFRGKISSEGWRRSVIVWVGEKMDRWSTRPMLLGLKERAEWTHSEGRAGR